MVRIVLTELEGLTPHEKTRPSHRHALKARIVKNRYLRPIVADRQSGTVLDGHHRLRVARELGLRRIPVVYVDYEDDALEVRSWRTRVSVRKKDVLARAHGRRLFAPKTTKHLFRGRHVSRLGGDVRVPVSELM